MKKVLFLLFLSAQQGLSAQLPEKEAFCTAVKDYLTSLQVTNLSDKFGELNREKSAKGWGDFYSTKVLFPGASTSEIIPSELLGNSFSALMARESEKLSYNQLFSDYFMWLTGMLDECLKPEGFVGEFIQDSPLYETAFVFRKKVAESTEESIMSKSNLVVCLYIEKASGNNRGLFLSIRYE